MDGAATAEEATDDDAMVVECAAGDGMAEDATIALVVGLGATEVECDRSVADTGAEEVEVACCEEMGAAAINAIKARLRIIWTEFACSFSDCEFARGKLNFPVRRPE